MADLKQRIVTRARSLDAFGLGAAFALPNPDPILKKLGQDIRVYRDLRADAHIGGSIRRRRAAVKALERGVDRGTAPSRVGKLIESVIAGLDMDRLISEMLDASLYGYAPLEVTWEKVGPYLLPSAVEGKPPEWFHFDEAGNLRFRSREAGFLGEELPPKKFLLPRQEASYANPYGVPDLAMCFWPAAFKKGGLQFWVQFTEKYGAPWVVGKHPRGAPPAEANALADKLEAMVQDAVAVIPDDASVEIMEAAGKAASAEVFERLLLFCRSEISIALLGQNQTTEKDSTHASASAGLEVTHDIRDSDAALVASAMNQLIRWIVDLNFGAGDAPVFSLWEQEGVDKLQAERDQVLAVPMAAAGVKFTRAYFEKAYSLDTGDLAEAQAPPQDVGRISGSPRNPPDAGTAQDFAESGDADPTPVTDYTEQLAANASGPLKDWLDTIRARVEHAESLEALRDELLTLYGDLPADELTQVMQTAFAAAHLAGRFDVRQESPLQNPHPTLSQRERDF